MTVSRGANRRPRRHSSHDALTSRRRRSSVKFTRTRPLRRRRAHRRDARRACTKRFHFFWANERVRFGARERVITKTTRDYEDLSPTAPTTTRRENSKTRIGKSNTFNGKGNLKPYMT